MAGIKLVHVPYKGTAEAFDKFIKKDIVKQAIVVKQIGLVPQ